MLISTFIVMVLSLILVALFLWQQTNMDKEWREELDKRCQPDYTPAYTNTDQVVIRCEHCGLTNVSFCESKTGSYPAVMSGCMMKTIEYTMRCDDCNKAFHLSTKELKRLVNTQGQKFLTKEQFNDWKQDISESRLEILEKILPKHLKPVTDSNLSCKAGEHCPNCGTPA